LTIGGPSQAGDQLPSITRGFLFADLRGYTSYVDEHGDHAGAEILERYRALVRAAVAGFRGAEIKTEGDSFYVVFDSASAAVRCGLAITEAASETHQGTAEPIRVGVGVHAGETVATAEGFVGSAVNIAARLCAQAKAGELVVSETVRSLTRTYLGAGFEPLGTRRLKGVEEPMAIYRVTPRGVGVARVRPRRAAGRQRWWLAGLGIVALVAVFGVAGMAVLRGSGPSPTAPPNALPTSAPTAPPSEPAGVTPSAAVAPSPSEAQTSAGPGTMTAAEQALLARIPIAFQPYCRRSSQPDGSLGGDGASLRCDLPIDSSPLFAADTVWYDAFSQPGGMALALNDVVKRQQLPEGACGPDGGTAVGRWKLGITFTGQVACYAKDGGAWLLWTYEGQQIAARAVRHDGDAKRLYTWWHEDASGFLR
jgi:class 3 adenylate cyclase